MAFSILPNTKIDSPPKHEVPGILKEVGNEGVWSVSTCKRGHTVEHLRDNRIDTYWQSEGDVPHLVNVQFQKRTTVTDIYIYANYMLDYHYTPSEISIRVGTHFNDLQVVESITLWEPSGWIHIPIRDLGNQLIRTFMIQIAITETHQNNRNTQVRQIKIYRPIEEHGCTIPGLGKNLKFSTVAFQQHATLR